MDRSVARVGSWAGWVSFAGILGFHLALVALAGQRVSGTTDLAAIRAYYAQPVVAVANVEQFLVVLAIAVFAVALRETLVGAASPERAASTRLLTGVALIAVTAEVAVILVEGSIQAALVASVAAGEPVVGLFRLWDVVYNSATYGLEATWILAFGLAMRTTLGFPRFLGWFAPVAALLLLVNVFAIWVGIPDALTLPASLALSIWLAAASFGLGRLGRVTAAKTVLQST